VCCQAACCVPACTACCQLAYGCCTKSRCHRSHICRHHQRARCCPPMCGCGGCSTTRNSSVGPAAGPGIDAPASPEAPSPSDVPAVQ
jgi:hypothetical protein